MATNQPEAGATTFADVKSTVITTVSSAMSVVVEKAKEVINKFMPPERWESLKKQVLDFARGHPLIASLAFGQIIFSGIPLVTFVVLTVGVFIFSLVAALLIAVLGALLFTTFCVGIALFILLPTLFITTFFGGAVWLWGWGAYYLVKWSGKFDTDQLTKMASGVANGMLGDGGKASKGEKQMGEYESKPPSYEETNSNAKKQGKRDTQNMNQSKTQSKPEIGSENDNQNTNQSKRPPKLEGGSENGVAKKTGSVNISDATSPVGDVKKRVDVGKIVNPVKGVAGGLL